MIALYNYPAMAILPIAHGVRCGYTSTKEFNSIPYLINLPDLPVLSKGNSKGDAVASTLLKLTASYIFLIRLGG
jgi:hypothetical protein